MEVDREDIITVAAPTARSLRITGIGPGEATISVFAADGASLSRTTLLVGSGAPFDQLLRTPIVAGFATACSVSRVSGRPTKGATAASSSATGSDAPI